MPVELHSPLDRSGQPGSDSAGGAFVLTGRHVLFMLLAFFAVIATVNAYFITVALKTLPGTEVKSPFEQSQKFNKGLEAIAEQDARGWQVDVVTGGLKPGAVMSVQLREKTGTPVRGVSVNLALQRPTDARFDHQIALKDAGDGVYTGTVPDIAAGLWRLAIEVTREGKREFFSESRIIAKE